MQAALVTAPGRGPVAGEFPAPAAGPGELHIRVCAAALSQVTRSRAAGGHYSSSGGGFPFVPGIDGTGVTDDGRRVYFAMPGAPHGAMAAETVVPASQCVPLPDGLDDALAAAIANPGLSSYAALTERAHLQSGETVLVNGATGAAGSLAVRIARHLGAGRIIATGRNPDALAATGADTAIRLGDGDPSSALQDAFAAGIDIVLDYLWGPSAEAILIAAARAAPEAVPIRYIAIGAASAADITLLAAALRASALQLMGSGIGSIPLPQLVAATGCVLQAAIPAGLTLPVRVMKLSEVAEAWAMEDRGARIVLAPDG